MFKFHIQHVLPLEAVYIVRVLGVEAVRCHSKLSIKLVIYTGSLPLPLSPFSSQDQVCQNI